MKFQTRPREGRVQGSRSINFSAHRGGTNVEQPMCNHLGSVRTNKKKNEKTLNKQKLRDNLRPRIRRAGGDTTRLAAPACCHYLLFTDRKW